MAYVPIGASEVTLVITSVPLRLARVSPLTRPVTVAVNTGLSVFATRVTSLARMVRRAWSIVPVLLFTSVTV